MEKISKNILREGSFLCLRVNFHIKCLSHVDINGCIIENIQKETLGCVYKKNLDKYVLTIIFTDDSI